MKCWELVVRRCITAVSAATLWAAGPALSLTSPTTSWWSMIRQVIADSPFAGEGYRKVGPGSAGSMAFGVGGKRVLRLMRLHGLLAPQRVRGRRRERAHDGTIIPDGPNLRWGTDATMAWTRLDGWVWVFANVDHWSAEAWTHVAKTGDRIAALQPVYDAVIDRFGGARPRRGPGHQPPPRLGTPIPLEALSGVDRLARITDDAAYIGEPETNGCAERFIRTLKEQCLWAELYDTVDDLRQAVRPGPRPTTTNGSSNATATRTPREAFASATPEVAA